jgi:hypothetical protein
MIKLYANVVIKHGKTLRGDFALSEVTNRI